MSEDIFDKYAELAIERGLISKGETDLQKKLENNPRWDSQDISTIELLYGVKPDAPKGMKYEKNIVEIAHPNAVIVAPSHDKLNGLVENLNECNNILINIVNKPTDGHLTGRKYASDDLVRALVRIANDMDNQNNEELRVLADTCLEQINKQALSWKDVTDFFSEKGGDVVDTAKGGGTGAIIGGIIGALVGGIPTGGIGTGAGAWAGALIGASAGSLIAAVTKTSPEAKNVLINAKDTLNQLNDLIKKFPSNQFLKTLNTKLATLIDMAGKYAALSNNPTGKIADTDETKTITVSYIHIMDDVKKDAALFKEKAENKEFAEDGSATSKIKTPFYSFMDDDVEDVIDSFNSLIKTINVAEAGMQTVQTTAHSAQTSAPAVPQKAKPSSDEEDLKSFQEFIKNHPGVDFKKLFGL